MEKYYNLSSLGQSRVKSILAGFSTLLLIISKVKWSHIYKDRKFHYPYAYSDAYSDNILRGPRFDTRPHSTVSSESDCRSRGQEFNPGPRSHTL